MAARSSKPKPITDRLVRVYEVILWPLNSNGEPSVDGPYEPFNISLGYPAHKAPGDPLSDDVKREAFKVALKHDGWERDEIEEGMATNTLHSLRFKFPKFIKAADTFEAKRARLSEADVNERANKVRRVTTGVAR